MPLPTLHCPPSAALYPVQCECAVQSQACCTDPQSILYGFLKKQLRLARGGGPSDASSSEDNDDDDDDDDDDGGDNSQQWVAPAGGAFANGAGVPAGHAGGAGGGGLGFGGGGPPGFGGGPPGFGGGAGPGAPVAGGAGGGPTPPFWNIVRNTVTISSRHLLLLSSALNHECPQLCSAHAPLSLPLCAF